MLNASFLKDSSSNIVSNHLRIHLPFAIGLWQPLNKAFIDVKVFNPLAVSNAARDLGDTALRIQEKSVTKNKLWLCDT